MRPALRALSYVGVLALGLFAGRLWGGSQGYAQLRDQVADRDSQELATRVALLSQLRLGRVDDAAKRAIELIKQRHP